MSNKPDWNKIARGDDPSMKKDEDSSFKFIFILFVVVCVCIASGLLGQ